MSPSASSAASSSERSLATSGSRWDQAPRSTATLLLPRFRLNLEPCSRASAACSRKITATSKARSNSYSPTAQYNSKTQLLRVPVHPRSPLLAFVIESCDSALRQKLHELESSPQS